MMMLLPPLPLLLMHKVVAVVVAVALVVVQALVLVQVLVEILVIGALMVVPAAVVVGVVWRGQRAWGKTPYLRGGCRVWRVRRA